MSDEKKPLEVALTILETALIEEIVKYLKNHAMKEVEHFISKIYAQSKHYTLDKVSPTPEEKT